MSVQIYVQDLFKKTLRPLDRVFEDSEVDIDEVDEVVLVGGSTRILKIQELVRNFFYGKV